MALRAENAALRKKVAEQDAEIARLGKRLEESKEEAKAWKTRYQNLQEQSRNEIDGLKLRVSELEKTLEEVRATLAWHQKNTFGSKSEKLDDEPEHNEPRTPKKKGKKEGAPGYGRKDRPGLITSENTSEVPFAQRICNCCGKPYKKLNRSDKSSMVELVQELMKVVDIGEKYVKDCTCDEGAKPRIVSAPPPPRVYPRAILGPRLLADILVEKFLFQKPLLRVSLKYQMLGADVPVSTICSALKKLDALFLGLYEQMRDRAKSADQWNMDETTWRVFGSNNSSKNQKWWLWAVVTKDCWVYILDHRRSAEVPKAFFQGVSEGILITDRYSAYKGLVSGIKKAYCWAHVRRDFMKIRDGMPVHRAWADDWILTIKSLYDLNDQRLAVVWRDGDEQYDLANFQVKWALEQIMKKAEKQLKGRLGERQQRVLKSLKKHWPGLTLFLDYPVVPMDNNIAERALRNPVVGRKNYYGSGSDWSGHFAAKMFTIMQTWHYNGLDPISMLEDFLMRTAETRGQPPPAADFIPWLMSEERKREFAVQRVR